MTSQKSDSGRVRFEGFEADLRTEELFRSGRRVRLPHQSFRVLAMLLERAGDLVTREELRAQLWPAGALVEYDQRVNTAVKRLREALRDSAEAPRFIETLPKRGYRFIAAIERNESRVPSATPDVSSAPIGVEGATPPPLKDAGVEQPERSGGNPEKRQWRDAGQPERGPAESVEVAGSSPSSGIIPLRRTMLLGAVLVLVIAGAWWVITHPAAIRPPTRQRSVPFTSLRGRVMAPTFSPDGSQVAFAWNGEAGDLHQFDLYVKSVGSERLLRLTRQPSDWISPAWSPDGSMIAFVRQGPAGTGGPGIFVIPALGGSERRLVSTGVAFGTYPQISWSPDGRRLAYMGYGPSGLPQVYLLSLDSLSRQPLSPAPDCQDTAGGIFSPDGKQLALACSSSSAVYSIDLVGLPHGPVRKLGAITGYPQGLAWAPNGTRLVFSSDTGDGGELWELTLDGQMTQLPFGEQVSAPAVAARTGRLAYVRDRKTVDIWRVDLTAAHPEESAVRLIDSTRSQMVARYSPDGARIVFQSNRSGSTEIWTTDSQGADPDRLTSFNGPFTSAPSWCSDGRRIAFDSRASGSSAVYIEDIRERVPRKVATSGANLSSPVWSQDCRWLFAYDRYFTLYRVAAAGGRAERATNRPSPYSSVSVVSDRLIFGVAEASGVVLWSSLVSGGPEVPLENMPRLEYGDSWAATPTGIYYTDSSSTPVVLNFYEFASHSTRRVMILKQTPVLFGAAGIAVSPDGRWLLYTQADHDQSEIMLAPGL
jgi:Tol biopolymer transport system component/DNA-binding winged helix-turn-helix (wHTH) protein